LSNHCVLELKNISKRFFGVHALNGVHFNAYDSKVNVLMGENGAGKSTLMKILAGAIIKDSGEIYINSEMVNIQTPEDSLRHKVAMIYQEFNLVNDLTVAENIFLGREPTKRGFVNKNWLISEAARLIEAYKLDISPTEIVANLSMAKKQMLEIVKALSQNAKIIVMDEPTSSLTEHEVEQLFSIIKRLNSDGVTVIYISHRMEEVFSIGDYVTVLRDGHFIGEWPLCEITQEQLITQMVGREITQLFPKEIVPIGEEVLRVENLSKKGCFDNISFSLRRGEILGLSGLIGAGRTEVALSLFGYYAPDSGDIYVKGNKVIIRHPSDAIKHRIAYVPEDRKLFGLDLTNKIRNNISVTMLDTLRRRGFIDFNRENELCREMVEKLRIKTPTIMQDVENLSGGNQQKVVLAKWIAMDVDILILDEPTRGIDVGAKEEIHRIIIELAKQGVGIILISSELPEILGMSDRVIIMHEGAITGVLEAKDATQESVMSYSTGIKKMPTKIC
jgi:ABC-type sugar transport system ATPase subunit